MRGAILHIMKATLANLKKALGACANAHKVEFSDWSKEDLQIGIKSETVPVVADIQMICKAFFGKTSMVETGWGYTTVYLDEAEMLPEVDALRLRLALPHGTRI